MGELQAEYHDYPLLVVSSSLVSVEQTQELMNVLKAAEFKSVTGIRLRDESQTGWPLGPNMMFRAAVEHIRTTIRQPFLWLEPDMIPLREGWMDCIANEYKRAGRPFMGAVFDKPWKHMVGIGCYPVNIAQFNPYCVSMTQLPFDVVRSELTLRHCHSTELIQHEWGDIPTNTPWTFPDQESVTRIRNNAVLFHRCKDRSLIARLREARNGTIAEGPKEKPEHITLVSSIKQTVSALLNGAHSFYHSGNLGDVMYALPAIKAYGGGDLYIGPEQRKTSPCMVPITQDQYDMLEPLLSQQEYLRNVEFSKSYPSGTFHDLNGFRNLWVDRKKKHANGVETLCQAHFWFLGIMDKFEEDRPWLAVPDPIPTGKIIIHRSPRYNSYNFPWDRLVEKRRKDLLFVGLPVEHEKFESDWKCKVSYWGVKNFLEMARIIAGGKAFVGNQSFPLSIAIGAGQRVIVEECPRSPDCRFKRDNYSGQLLTAPEKLDFESL